MVLVSVTVIDLTKLFGQWLPPISHMDGPPHLVFSGKDESSLLKTQIAQGSFGAIPKTTTTHGQAREQAQPILTSKKAKKRKGKGGAKTRDDQPPAKAKSEFKTEVSIIFCSFKSVIKALGDHLMKGCQSCFKPLMSEYSCMFPLRQYKIYSVF